jgi:hypothetical protein
MPNLTDDLLPISIAGVQAVIQASTRSTDVTFIINHHKETDHRQTANDTAHREDCFHALIVLPKRKRKRKRKKQKVRPSHVECRPRRHPFPSQVQNLKALNVSSSACMGCESATAQLQRRLRCLRVRGIQLT